MGPAALQFLTCVALIPRPFPTDTATYADASTRLLVARAMARHVEQDSSVRDYQAKLRYRVSFGFAKRRWGDPVPVAVEEQDATVMWQLPNDLRVDMLGRRSASQLEGVDLTSTFSHPWFVPRTLGDSVRIFGASQTPSRAAPHPLAPGAERFYRYAAGDSVVITAGAQRITIRSITVVPKPGDGAFVVGRLWVDVSSGDIVRFTFRFVGTNLWVDNDDMKTAKDSAAAVRSSKFVSRILELDADLEFSLQDRKYWMPYRQVISGKVSLPFGIDFAVPFEARTTFDDYVVNGGTRIVFDAPFPRDSMARSRNSGRILAQRDSARGTAQTPTAPGDSTHPRADSGAFRSRFRNRTGYLPGGGRYEIHRPSLDSMRRYRGWSDSLVLQENANDRRRLHEAVSDLAHITEGLPAETAGRPRFGLTWEKVADILRYNRVEGTTLSRSVRVPLPIAFADLYGTARFGLADHRLMARVSMVRDAPAGRLTLAASRDLADADPFASGLTLGNSLRAAFTGHDDGAYLLAQGGRLTFETSKGPGTELTWSARAEDESSVSSRARALIPRISGADGYFPPTEPVREGFAAGAGLRVTHAGFAVHWMADLDGVAAGGAGAARLAATLQFQRLAGGWVTARINGGLAIGTDSVPQEALRAGGLNTVRGYDFGVAAGDALWSAQLDVSRPGRGAVKLVGFLDAGQAGRRSDFGAAPLLSGAGIGVSVLRGLIRADLSHPLTQTRDRGFRFDLVFGSVR